MKHATVLFVALLMIAGPLASISDKAMLEEIAPSHTNKNEGPFVAISENTLRILKQDGTEGNQDDFIVKQSVMDADGNTYISGNLAYDSLLLGDLPIINLNDAINRVTMHHSPVIAKMAPDGQWLWATVPIPTTGDACGNTPLSQTNGAIMGIALSHDEEELAVVGDFEGCYTLQNQTLLASGDGENGLVFKLNSTSGDLHWMVNIAAQVSSISLPMVRLNAVHFSSDDATVFIGGTYIGSLPSSRASGGTDLHSDNPGDAYIGILSAEDGSEILQRDSCPDNDAGDTGETCGVGSDENIASIELNDGEVFFFTQARGPSTPFTLFGSDEMSTSSNGKFQSYAWSINENSPYQDVGSSAITFGLDDDAHYLVYGSAAMNGVVYALIQTGSPLAWEMVVGDATTNTSVHFTSDTPSIMPYGMVQGSGTDTYVVYATDQPADYSIVSNDGTTLATQNLSGDIGFLSVESNYTEFIELNGEFDAYQNGMAVAGNQHYVSLFGQFTPVNKAAVFAYDNDGDGIPNMQDLHINLNANLDDDDDGIDNRDDNCRFIWNVDQVNTDNDSRGDACDTDIDGDGVNNSIPVNLSSSDNDDACPYVYAGVPNDLDRNGCIDDSDADGVPDNQDLCPGHDDDVDDDADGIIDGCDDYLDDTDNDAVINSLDNCPTDPNTNQTDMDNDEIGDTCDDDIDGDDVTNHVPFDDSTSLSDDQCPYTNALNNDDDGDGCPDPPATNDDLDGDGVANQDDYCPGGDDTVDTDEDGVPDDCDDEPFDYDNDRIIDDDDNCPLMFNPNQEDLNGDNTGDACDDDIDGDGVENSLPLNLSDESNLDACPYVDASGQDGDRDGCIDQTEAVQCPTCNTTNQSGGEGNGITLLDPDDATTIVFVGGTGIVGGGLLSVLVRKLRNAGKYVDIGDGLELVRHIPKRKKKDENADHYFRRGLVRQREMTLSADKNLDDYIEENDAEGGETNE